MRKLRALETLCWLIAARAAVAFVPFRWLAARLGSIAVETAPDLSMSEVTRARIVGGRIRGVMRRVGWRPSCLVRSTAAMILLRRAGLEGTLYVGVARDGDQQIKAHAWVRCGPVYVTGGRERHEFDVLTTFARRS